MYVCIIQRRIRETEILFFFFKKRRLAGGMVELAKLHQSDYWETLCEGAHNKCFHKVTDVRHQKHGANSIVAETPLQGPFTVLDTAKKQTNKKQHR